MNKNFIMFGLFAMALSMAACSQDDLASELNEVEAIEGVAEAPEVVSGYASSTRSVVVEDGEEFSFTNKEKHYCCHMHYGIQCFRHSFARGKAWC